MQTTRRSLTASGLVFLILLSPITALATTAGTPQNAAALQDIAVSSPMDVDSTGTEQAARTTRSDYIIVFANDSVRHSHSINQTGASVTGGQSVDILPLLFVTATVEQVQAIAQRPGVLYVVADEQVVVTTSTSEPSTATTDNQSVPWGVERINARTAAEDVPASAQQNVTVAVLDTGIDIDHPDLDDNVVWGANFSNDVMQYGLSTADDNEGHGTAVAGLLAAENNSRDIIGVAPNIDLYSVKVLNKSGAASYSWLIRGLEAALEGPDGELGSDDGADIVSMSLGGSTGSKLLEDAIENASEHAIIVASAGNNGDGNISTNEVEYPAKYPEAIAVAATSKSANDTTEFSAEGAEVEIAAPGVDLLTTANEGGTALFAGTSASAPLVSGVLALLMAADLTNGSRTLSDTELRTIVRDTARDIDATGVDNTSGYGLIQAAAAVNRTNTAPLADAGSNQSSAEGTTVILNGTASSDPEGDSLTYNWTQIAGPDVSLSNETSATPSFTAPLVDANQTLSFELTVTDSAGNVDSDTVKVTVTNTSAVDVVVELRPQDASIEPTESVTYNVVVTNVSNGVGAYNLSVAMVNTSLAEIVNVTLSGDPAIQSIEYGPENASVSITTGLMETADTGNVTLANITVLGEETGETIVDVSVNELADESGASYTVGPISEATITVNDSLAPIIGDRPPTDPDDDGVYEDVNGDGGGTLADVQALFANRNSDAVQNNEAAFDFNGDGTFSLADIQALFAELT